MTALGSAEAELTASATDTWRGHFSWLVYAMFVVLLGSTVPTPLYDLYRAEWHTSTFTMTVVFASYVVGVLAALVFGGHLSDYIGRRPVALVAALFVFASALVFEFATNVLELNVARLLTGLGVGLCAGAVTSALRDLHPNPAHGALASSVATSGGLAAGPLLGGLAARWAPFPLHTVYLGYLVLLVIALIAVVRVPETGCRRRPVPWQPRIGVPHSLRRQFVRPALAVCCAYAVNGLYSALAPTVAREYLGASVLVGSLTVVLMLGVSAVAQVALHARPAHRAQREGLWLLTAGLLLVLPALSWHSPTVFAGATAVTGLGQGLAFRGSLTLVSETAPAADKGRMISAYYVGAYVATAVPVLAVGAIAEEAGLFTACAAFVAAIGATALATTTTFSRSARKPQ
ncbi:MFS transporter [Streptomyces sp. NPDC001793]|uniref:MFS transporter n=1 Tax=Streptomyces sp. NPDC001793 TaxID=3154657 RepID=UPI00331D3060